MFLISTPQLYFYIVGDGYFGEKEANILISTLGNIPNHLNNTLK